MSTAPERFQHWNACWLGELAPDEVHLYLCSLDWEQASLDWTGGWLSDTEKARAEQLVDPVKRNRFSAARASLRWLLANYLNQPPHMVTIHYEEGGKPYVPGVHFNVSHSRDRALIAITRTCSVGVDVEFIDPGVSFWQVAALAFTPQERQVLSAIPGEEQHRAFYEMWTSKEALLKAHGCELDITKLADRSSNEEADVPTSRVLRLSLEQGWTAALALTKPLAAVTLRYGYLD